MLDERSEKMVQLLEEIRDLTKLRNEHSEKMVQESRRRTDELVQLFAEIRADAKAARLVANKRFYVALAAIGVLVMTGCILIFVLG